MRKLSFFSTRTASLMGCAAVALLLGGQPAMADVRPVPTAVAQSKVITVTGQVLDKTGLSVIGASVVLKGDSSKGTITDLDGNFTLETFARQKSV